jgi:hypothetical protein
MEPRPSSASSRRTEVKLLFVSTAVYLACGAAAATVCVLDFTSKTGRFATVARTAVVFGIPAVFSVLLLATLHTEGVGGAGAEAPSGAGPLRLCRQRRRRAVRRVPKLIETPAGQRPSSPTPCFFTHGRGSHALIGH